MKPTLLAGKPAHKLYTHTGWGTTLSVDEVKAIQAEGYELQYTSMISPTGKTNHVRTSITLTGIYAFDTAQAAIDFANRLQLTVEASRPWAWRLRSPARKLVGAIHYV